MEPQVENTVPMPPVDNNSENNSRKRLVIIAISSVAVVALAIGGIVYAKSGAKPIEAPAPLASASAGAKEQMLHAGCTTTEKPIDNPVRFEIPAMKVNSQMISVGNDPDGSPGAPSKKRLYDAAWYKLGPKLGSHKGKAIVNIHTFKEGKALGNDMNAQLKPGDIIKVVDKSGAVVCYRYRDKLQFLIEDYDYNSNIYHDDEGQPQMAIMICWDVRRTPPDYDSRIIFYGDYIPPQGLPKSIVDAASASTVKVTPAK